MDNKNKVIPLPEMVVGEVRKDTVRVAGVIDREMKALQKKYPQFFFELSFELQRLPPKSKFYRIHIKTFKDE